MWRREIYPPPLLFGVSTQIVYPIFFFFVITIGYTFVSLALNYYFYFSKNVESCKNWKIQQTNKTTTASLGKFFSIPIFSSKPNREKYHVLFCTLNLAMAGLFASCVSFAIIKGWTRIVKEAVGNNNENDKNGYGSSITENIALIIFDFIKIVVYECVVEYYWHRANHIPFLYRHFHKYHHAYKAPEPFDDMMIHPLEAFGYYCILYSPPFVFSLRLPAFVAYMILMGVCGVLDHSGVRLSIPYLYSVDFHDKHHQYFNCNYAFPFTFMDIIHSTVYKS